VADRLEAQGHKVFLAGLTGLAERDLSYNAIADVTPLAGLTQLEFLWLDYNQIADVTPLAGLTALRSLTLSTNRIADVTPLAGLANLRWLSLGDNRIRDVSALSPAIEQFYARDQAATLTVSVGTRPAPVANRTGHPANLTVTSGDATINADGTITYRSRGQVVLAWGEDTPLSAFSGQVTVTVAQNDIAALIADLMARLRALIQRLLEILAPPPTT